MEYITITWVLPQPKMSILQRCCTSHIIKICYIFCAVTFTISFIVGGFLVHLLMLPYLHESDFKPGICQVNSIKLVNSQPWPGPGGGGRLKCENKCSKERSAFPCLKVSIFFEKDGHNRTGILFDTIMTHQSYRQYGVCVLYPICVAEYYSIIKKKSE